MRGNNKNDWKFLKKINMFKIPRDRILEDKIYKHLQYYHESERNIRNYFDSNTADNLLSDLRRDILQKIEDIILNEQ